MVVVGGYTVGAWALFFIAIMDLVGFVMEVVDKEHEGHSHDGLVTRLKMPEHLLCARLAHRCHVMGRMLSGISVWQ